MDDSAASILRGARLRAAMTQNEVATRAGVAQSVISAYESGAREPSVATLRKLVEATGFRLDLGISEGARTVPLRVVVENHREELLAALGALGARNIRLFGSVSRGTDGPHSDVDLLVDIGPDVGLFALGRMRTEAERILATSVDIVPADGLKPGLADGILQDAIAL